MRLGHVLFSISLGLLLARATPLSGEPKSVSLPLHRHFSLYESDDAQGTLPLKVNGLESLVYTVDVQVGSQRFNLTLDMSTQGAVLFSKDFAVSNPSCSTGDARRNLFDPRISKTFLPISDLGDSGGWSLNGYPYIGLANFDI